MAEHKGYEETVMNTAQLSLDPHSPRHYHPWGTPSQEWLTDEVLKHEATLRILRAMEAESYIGAPPLLAVEESGQTVVIDGNRRLAALRQHVANQKQETPPVSILLLENRHQAMRHRIQRERAQGTLWTRLGHALHYRSLRASGMDNDEINNYYGHTYPAAPGLGSDVDHLVQAVDLLDKANALSQNQWATAGDFQRLARALTISQVRERLKLEPARDHQADSRHGQETLRALLELMTLLCGRRDQEDGLTPAAFRNLEEIDYLREILESDAMTARLLDQGHRTSPQRIVEEAHGRYGYSEISSQLHELKTRAQAILDGMKIRQDAELPYPADLQVASVSYEVHGNGVAQFRLLLAGTEPGPNAEAAALLQRELSVNRPAPCRVSVAAAPAPTEH